LHGDIAAVTDRSNGYTEEEQEAADENAAVERQRLGGAGGRAGVGIDYRLTPYVAIGARYSLSAHWGMQRTDESTDVSSWVRSETTLSLTFELPESE
jgi:hypothetical protein